MLGPAIGVVAIGPTVGGARVGSGVAAVTIGPTVGVVSTLQVVSEHSTCDVAVEIKKLKGSPVDQKLALSAKPVKSASIANATSERAMAYRFWVLPLPRCR